MFDKFYRTQITTSIQIYDAIPRTPEPKSYDITKEGHTEWRKKRLRNVDDPELPGDVVNKKYLKTEVGKCLVLENDKFDAKGKSITEMPRSGGVDATPLIDPLKPSHTQPFL